MTDSAQYTPPARTESTVGHDRPESAVTFAGIRIQDTSELDFTTQPGTAGLGRLNLEARQGLYLHPTLAVSDTGVALGVLDQGFQGGSKASLGTSA